MTYMSQVDRRQQLIEAAIRVLQRDGVGHVTTRAIAAEAGAPLASIHYTFGSKDEIVRAAFEQVITDLLAELEAGVTPGAGIQAAANDLCRAVGGLLDILASRSSWRTSRPRMMRGPANRPNGGTALPNVCCGVRRNWAPRPNRRSDSIVRVDSWSRGSTA